MHNYLRSIGFSNITNKRQMDCLINEIIKNVPYIPNIAQIRNEPKKEYSNYEQRDYSNFDFSKLYANKGVWYKWT